MESVYHNDDEGVILKGEVRQCFKRLNRESGWAAKQGNIFKYEYHIKDHLGNVRVTFTDDNNDGITERKSINDYYSFGMEWNNKWELGDTISPKNKYRYNGKEFVGEMGWDNLMYGARNMIMELGRFSTLDPASFEYSNVSPYVYVLNNPVRAIDPDGRRVFFVGGAGNDNIGWNYINRWKSAFEKSGIGGFKRLNVSHDNAKRVQDGGLPFNDMMFTSGYASSRYNSTMNRLGSVEYKIVNREVTKAISNINSDLKNNPLAKGEQLNLAGYSYGSVIQAHTALGLADQGKYINNLILIGSPISSSSDLFNELTNHKNIGNVIRVDIQGDYLSDPQGAMDLIKGAFQNLGIDGPHFDLARPGTEADVRIQKTTDELKRKGVN